MAHLSNNELYRECKSTEKPKWVKTFISVSHHEETKFHGRRRLTLKKYTKTFVFGSPTKNKKPCTHQIRNLIHDSTDQKP